MLYDDKNKELSAIVDFGISKIKELKKLKALMNNPEEQKKLNPFEFCYRGKEAIAELKEHYLLLTDETNEVKE